MDVLSQSFNVSQSVTYREDVKIQFQKNSPSPVENPVSETNSQESNPIRFHLQPGGLSQDDILKYFEENTSAQINQRIDDLEGQLTSREDFDLSMLSKLFNMDDKDRERELKRLMREMDQAEELERIIFGEGNKSKSKNLEIEAKFEFQISLKQEASQQSSNFVDLSEFEFEARDTRSFRRREVDPLVFDLNGDGIQTTGVDKGIEFDMDGDDRVEKSSFVSGDDFALALDRDGNGRIDSGRELFGDQNGARDGIEELRKYDDNRDGKINKNDAIFNELRLVNRGSLSRTLEQSGVEEIDLNRLKRSGFTNMGDRVQDGLKVRMADGSSREALDVYFQTRRKS